MNPLQKIEGSFEQKPSENDPKQQTPQKRRGRPEKKPEPFFEEGEQLFTLHDNIFHASILFYTFHIFDKAPTRRKFNPTIGFSVYQKVKNFPTELKEYYDDDQIAKQEAEPYKQNFHLRHFFINAMTFGPKCVIDEFYELFHFIIRNFQQGEQINVNDCLNFIVKNKLKYINFDNNVLDFLQAKSVSVRESLKEHIKKQLKKLLQIILHTLECLLKGQKENRFAYILQSDEEMFQRGIHTKSKKKVKKQ